jgi:hypothetical protein
MFGMNFMPREVVVLLPVARPLGFECLVAIGLPVIGFVRIPLSKSAAVRLLRIIAESCQRAANQETILDKYPSLPNISQLERFSRPFLSCRE